MTTQTITPESTLPEVQARKEQVSALSTLLSSAFSLLSYLASYDNPMEADDEVKAQLFVAYEGIWQAHQLNHEIWKSLQAHCEILKKEATGG